MGEEAPDSYQGDRAGSGVVVQQEAHRGSSCPGWGTKRPPAEGGEGGWPTQAAGGYEPSGPGLAVLLIKSVFLRTSRQLSRSVPHVHPRPLSGRWPPLAGCLPGAGRGC